jgi:E3 ubiquitin-protein ligase synoviolin
VADQSNVPILNTTTHTESLASQQESSVLPDWGSSQLFSASSRAVNGDDTSSSSALPLGSGEEQEASADRGPGSSAESGTEEEQRRREKGKAKAATVEDTVDEAEGA